MFPRPPLYSPSFVPLIHSVPLPLPLNLMPHPDLLLWRKRCTSCVGCPTGAGGFFLENVIMPQRQLIVLIALRSVTSRYVRPYKGSSENSKEKETGLFQHHISSSQHHPDPTISTSIHSAAAQADFAQNSHGQETRECLTVSVGDISQQMHLHGTYVRRQLIRQQGHQTR